jgi:transposase
MNRLRRLFIEGRLTRRAAKELHMSTITVWRYQKEFEQIQLRYPDRLNDMDFYLPPPERTHRPTPLYTELMQLLPGLMASAKPGTRAKPLWRKYRVLKPNGYSYDDFKRFFYKHLDEYPHLKKPPLLASLPEKDIEVLNTWRRSNDHRKWMISRTLTLAAAGASIPEIRDKTDAGRDYISAWLKIYRTRGIEGLERKKTKTPNEVVHRMQKRKEDLIRLLHETPKLYGINRTSWTILDLTRVYNEQTSHNVTDMAISYSLRKMGFKFKKSRDMLTSQDPKFREKIARIQSILQHLKPTEKFFSIDEYGPVGIRIHGGRMLKHKSEAPLAVPHRPRCKGSLICIAALELSTNQVTHFYAQKRNTFEMIKLVDILVGQYAEQRRIYLCWDAVSWHRSQILYNYIKEHNEAGKPEIVIAPLPSATQFLNVIESVFGGLARAVIHNSDYASIDECKAAIDLHFRERNQHFITNPKRAGNKIWGKEVVAPQFSDLNHCRNRNAMRGTSYRQNSRKPQP